MPLKIILCYILQYNNCQQRNIIMNTILVNIGFNTIDKTETSYVLNNIDKLKDIFILRKIKDEPDFFSQ